jgi:nucleoside-triphosphatase THEP1
VKILITGEPGSGKSTLLEALLHDTSGHGILTRELVDSSGRRQGFQAYTSTGLTATIAAATSSGEPRVGRFQVYPERITELVRSLDTPRDGSALVYIDEIGQMQLTSKPFQTWVETIFATEEDITATVTQIHQSALIESLKNRADTLLVSITAKNRVVMLECLMSALKSRHTFNRLSEIQRQVVLDNARKYLRDARYTSFKKLFDKAVFYTQQNKVARLAERQFIVQGQHGAHYVHHQSQGWVCDCPLFLGTNPYTHSEECSHIQAVSLFCATR